MKKKHLLLIRFSSIGDIVLQTHLVRALRDYYNNEIKITFLTSPEFSCLLENNKDIDHLLLLKREKGITGFRNILNEVKKYHEENHIDFIVDLHGTLRSNLLKLFLWNIPSVTVNKRKLERFFLVKLKINLYKILGKEKENLIYRNFKDLAEPLGLQNLNPLNYTTHISLRSERSEKLIVLAPGAAHKKKRWPESSFFNLAKNLLEDKKFEDYKIKVLAGPDDLFCKIFDELSDLSPSRFENLQGKTNLKQTMEVISKAKFLVGNDTGLCHIAEALGIPVIMLMGPTSPYFGFYPYKPSSILLENSVWCRPCHHTGAGKCFRSENYCLTGISVDKVKESLLSLC